MTRRSPDVRHADGATLFRGALGETRLDEISMRPMTWGPHEVGGAKLRAECL